MGINYKQEKLTTSPDINRPRRDVQESTLEYYSTPILLDWNRFQLHLLI